MAIITVTTLNDTIDSGDGVFSLREAIATANADPTQDYTIVFDRSLVPGGIFDPPTNLELDQGDIVISNNVTIDGDINGDGRADIALHAKADGQALHRIFTIDGGNRDIQVELNSLVLENGATVDGGAVLVGDGDTLIARAVTIQLNKGDVGGALFLSQGASAEIYDSVLRGNESEGSGGAIYADNAKSLKIVNTTFHRNEAAQGIYDANAASAIHAVNTDLTILNSTFVQNGQTSHGAGETVAVVVDGGTAEIKNTIISANGIEGTDSFNGDHSVDNNVRFENIAESDLETANNLIGGDPDQIFANNIDQLLRSDDEEDVGTFPILEGGLAHNQGSNADVNSDYDARGFGYLRTSDDTVDIGAYELQGTADPADDPTDLDLNNTSVEENAVGAVIGRLTVDDPDHPQDTTDFTYAVSDSRFEVVNGELKLKDGNALDHEQESEVSLDITVKDPDDNTYTETFTIQVGNLDELVVTTLEDIIDPTDGEISLREALMHANANVGTRDTITFAEGLEGTIRLKADQDPGNNDPNNGLDYSNSDYGSLIYARNVIIDGDNRITISGDTADNDLTTMHGDIEVTDLSQMDADSPLLADNVAIFQDTGQGSSISTAAVFKGLTLTGGVAVDGGGNGGAINAGGQDVVIQDSLLIGNQATTRGGAVWGNSGELVILDSTITGNRAGTTAGGDGGGGISHSTTNWGGLTVVNSTITNNYAVGDGGGISLVYAGGSVKESLILNSTITGNNSAGNGGGIEAEIDLTIANSLILGNAAGGTNNEIEGNNRASYSGKNLIGVPNGDFDATGIAEVDNAALADVFAALQDYLLSGVTGGALADNGGPVWTVALRDSVANPALDKGDDTVLSEAILGLDINADRDTNDTLDRDARGGARPINTVDIGAFELGSLSPKDLNLSDSSVEENAAGAVIGDLAVTGPNGQQDTTDYDFTVSDARFEVVNGQLVKS